LNVAIEDFKSAWGRAQEAENKLRTLLNDLPLAPSWQEGENHG